MRIDAALLQKIDQWLAEDVGHGDLTTQSMIDEGMRGRFALVAREPLTLAGIAVAGAVFSRVDAGIEFRALAQDGARCEGGEELAVLEGPARGILTAERTALNIVQHLSGIATLTARYCAALSGSRVRLLDTRKTTPGLRTLEKYAVRCGGGHNHRLGLDGGVMLKDNHIAVRGSIAKAVAAARAAAPFLTMIEVECETLEDVRAAVEAGADVVMLDNMDVETMAEAVRLIDGRALTECSGGVTLETIAQKAASGVDAISVGRITQSAAAVDIGLDAR